MSVRADVAKMFCQQESAAENSARGMDSGAENSRTSSPADGAAISPKIVSGNAEPAIDAITPARNGRLSSDEQMVLARIRRNHKDRFLLSIEEQEYLLELVERLAA